jgi:small subunit ribosomal protein S21
MLEIDAGFQAAPLLTVRRAGGPDPTLPHTAALVIMRGSPVKWGDGKTRNEARKEERCMAIRIKARSGESAEQILRRFKKMCEKEGLTKDMKRQAYFEKPSERRRRAQRKMVKRATQVPMVRGPR